MENNLISVVLLVVFGLVFVAAAVCAGIFFWNRLFHRTVDNARRRIADSQLIVSVNTGSSGRRLVFKVSPFDLPDEDPEFPEEPMGGQDMPVDLLDSFFSGSLPQEQMEYIESKLRLQNIFIKRDSDGRVVSEAAPQEDTSFAKAQEPEKPADNKEATGESHSDLPFGDDCKDEKQEVENKEEAHVPDIDDIVGIDPEEEADFEHIESGSDIPSYLMDILVNATQNDVKVVCYYCACRLGIQIDYDYSSEQREHNCILLHSLQEQFDGKDKSEVVSFTVDFSGTRERRNSCRYPVIEDTVVSGPSFARHSIES